MLLGLSSREEVSGLSDAETTRPRHQEPDDRGKYRKQGRPCESEAGRRTEGICQALVHASGSQPCGCGGASLKFYVLGLPSDGGVLSWSSASQIAGRAAFSVCIGAVRAPAGNWAGQVFSPP